MCFHDLLVRLRLLFAGWRPNRDVLDRLLLPGNFEIFGEAQRILREYGGLKIRRPSEIIHFDPSAGEEVAGQITEYEHILDRRLYPLGYYEHQDRLHLLVDELGVMYLLSLSDNPGPLAASDLEPLSSCFEKGVDFLLRGIVPRQERYNDLRSVDMLGKIWSSVP